MRKRATEIEPGDVIAVLGSWHRITEIAPYEGPFDFIIGIAKDGTGWGISLEESATMEVAG